MLQGIFYYICTTKIFNMATTGAAAYQRLKEPDNAISQGLQFWGGIEAQQGAEHRARNERNDIAKAKEAKDYQERITPKGDEFLNISTGFDDTDANYRQYSQEVIGDYASLSREAMQAQASGNILKAREIEGQMAVVKNNFKNITAGQKGAAELFKNFKTAAEKGSISGQDEDIMLKLMDNVAQGKAKLVYDKNSKTGNYVTEIENDRGQKETITIPNGALIDGSINWRDKVNITGDNGFVDNTLKQLGKRTYDTVSGYYINTNQKWDEKAERAADARIDVILSSPNSASDVLYQMTGKKTPIGKPISEEDEAIVRQGLMDAIKGGYDEKSSKKTDLSIPEFNERVRHNKAMEDAASKPKVKPKTAEEESLSARHYDIKKVMDDNDVSQFGGDFKYGGRSGNASSAKVLGNNIVLDVTYTDKKGKSTTEKLVIPKNERTINNLFDAFSKKPLSFEKVVATEPYAYREPAKGVTTTTMGEMSSFFSKDGSFNNDDDGFIKALKQLYPEANLSNPWSFLRADNAIKVNGKEIKLDKKNNDINSLFKEIDDALGAGDKPSAAVQTKPTAKADPLGILN